MGMINDSIYNKALDIIQQRENEREYLLACRKAGLCPKCGPDVLAADGYIGLRLITWYSCPACGRIYY